MALINRQENIPLIGDKVEKIEMVLDGIWIKFKSGKTICAHIENDMRGESVANIVDEDDGRVIGEGEVRKETEVWKDHLPGIRGETK